MISDTALQVKERDFGSSKPERFSDTNDVNLQTFIELAALQYQGNLSHSNVRAGKLIAYLSGEMP